MRLDSASGNINKKYSLEDIESIAYTLTYQSGSEIETENEIIYKHALKNSLSPVVTLAGIQFSAVVSGAVLVEAVFSWPGLGSLALQSIIARDTPTILGILFFSALVVIVGNLITDMILRMIDPRVGSKG